jgi:hypothetical protein
MVDERITRDGHGDYYSRTPYDDAAMGGSGAGLLFAIMVIGAIVLGLFFLASGDGTTSTTGTEPAIAPADGNAATAPAADSGTATTTTGN